MHKAGAPGRIVEDQLTREVDYVMGDGTAAYEGRLRRYRRHVAFVKPDVIVLYDDLLAQEAATFQFMLHALREFRVDEGNATLRVEQPKASVTVRYLSPTHLRFRQWDGYEPKPTRELPNQWHVEAGTQERLKELGVVTVIVPERAGRDVEWTAAWVESETAVGTRIRRGGKEMLVGFRKAGAAGEAWLAGVRFEGSVVVR
jgi:hypothetical protein